VSDTHPELHERWILQTELLWAFGVGVFIAAALGMILFTALFVDALNAAFGKQTTQRSAHAKGVVLLGKFVPGVEAASVSKALHFKHEVPVTARFSANTGMAKIADADPQSSGGLISTI
jgi:catalase